MDSGGVERNPGERGFGTNSRTLREARVFGRRPRRGVASRRDAGGLRAGVVPWCPWLPLDRTITSSRLRCARRTLPEVSPEGFHLLFRQFGGEPSGGAKFVRHSRVPIPDRALAVWNPVGPASTCCTVQAVPRGRRHRGHRDQPSREEEHAHPQRDPGHRGRHRPGQPRQGRVRRRAARHRGHPDRRLRSDGQPRRLGDALRRAGSRAAGRRLGPRARPAVHGREVPPLHAHTRTPPTASAWSPTSSSRTTSPPSSSPRRACSATSRRTNSRSTSSSSTMPTRTWAAHDPAPRDALRRHDAAHGGGVPVGGGVWRKRVSRDDPGAGPALAGLWGEGTRERAQRGRRWVESWQNKW